MQIIGRPRTVIATLIGTLLVAATGSCGGASGAPSTPSVAPTTSLASTDFSLFVGDWSGHGSYLSIRPDGSFTMGMRTYRSCDQAPPPCDKVTGHEIISGNIATGNLISVSGSAATGEIRTTTDPADTPAGPITFTLDTGTDVISAQGTNFCGPNAPDGTCGA